MEQFKEDIIEALKEALIPSSIMFGVGLLIGGIPFLSLLAISGHIWVAFFIIGLLYAYWQKQNYNISEFIEYFKDLLETGLSLALTICVFGIVITCFISSNIPFIASVLLGAVTFGVVIIIGLLVYFIRKWRHRKL